MFNEPKKTTKAITLKGDENKVFDFAYKTNIDYNNYLSVAH